MAWTLIGGPNYAVGEPEFDDLAEAIDEWIARCNQFSRPQFPLWGDSLEYDDYVIVDYDACQGLTLVELRPTMDA